MNLEIFDSVLKIQVAILDKLGYCREAERFHKLEDFPYDASAEEWSKKPKCACLSDVACTNGCGLHLGHGSYMRLVGLEQAKKELEEWEKSSSQNDKNRS